MAVPDNLRPTYTEKILRAMKAERAVKRITFDRTEASPGETLYVCAQAEQERGSGAGFVGASF